MIKQGVAPHESVEIHELLVFKNICMTKSITMSPLVSDEELKAILQQDVSLSQAQIQELAGLMEQSVLVRDVSLAQH